MTQQPSPLVEAMRMEGIGDLKASAGMKCCAAFARAWLTEQEAGKTTPEAEAYLAEAIKLEGEALSRK